MWVPTKPALESALEPTLEPTLKQYPPLEWVLL